MWLGRKKKRRRGKKKRKEKKKHPRLLNKEINGYHVIMRRLFQKWEKPGRELWEIIINSPESGNEGFGE